MKPSLIEPGALEQERLQRSALEVTVMFGESVLDIRHLVPPRGLTIGEGARADLFVAWDGLIAPEFPLIRCDGDRFVLTFREDQKGEVALDGVVSPIAWFRQRKDVIADPNMPRCYRYTLPKAAKVTLRFDSVTVLLRHVSAPEKLVEPAAKKDLRYLVGLFVVSVALLGLFAFLAFALPTPEAFVPPEYKIAHERSARLLLPGMPAVTVTPAVAIAEPGLVLGALSEDDVRAALGPLRASLDACRANGAVVLVEVDADGRAGRVEAADDAASRCVAFALEQAQFAPPVTGQARVEVRLR